MMPVAVLGDVAKIDRTSIASTEIGSATRYIGLEHIEEDGSVSDSLTVEPGELKSNKYRFSPNHILFGKLRPNLGKVAAPGFEGVCSTDILPIEAGPTLDRKYLYHYLRQPSTRSEATRLAVGANLPRLKPQSLAEFKIPMPPIEEQRRIAVVLDAADGLRSKRRQVIAKLNTLTQAIFIDMFGDPVTNARSWPGLCLEESLLDLKYGHRFYDQGYSSDGIRMVRITDLSELGELDFASMPRMDVTSEEREKYQLRPGDVIFARSGASVGKVALISSESPDCIAGAYFICMRFNDSINPEYARALLASPSIRAIIVQQSRQSAQQNFSGPALKRLPMRVPPLILQAEFAKRLQEIRLLSLLLTESLRDHDALFASLQQRAFRGDL